MKERLANSILCGLWFEKNKPHINNFLNSFVELMKNVSKSEILKNVMNVKIFCICRCVYSVARAPMQGLTQFNGHYGCSWCLHPGKYAAGSVRYPILSGNDVIADRNHVTSLQCIRQALEEDRRVFGFKNASALVRLSKFDIISGFVPDHLHNVQVGICEQFFVYWLATRHPYTSIDDDPTSVIDDILTSNKVPI